MSKTINKKGFALPTVIFLLAILSILSVGLILMNSYFQKSTINDILDIKVTFVAKLGVDYGTFLASKNGNCLSTPQTVALSESHLNDFKFTYDCIENIVNEAGINESYYKITAYACNTKGSKCPEPQGRPTREDYVEKSLTVISK